MPALSAGTLDHALDLVGCELQVLQFVCWGGYTARSHDFDKVRAAADFLAHGGHAFGYAVAQAAEVVVAIASAAFCGTPSSMASFRASWVPATVANTGEAAVQHLGSVIGLT